MLLWALILVLAREQESLLEPRAAPRAGRAPPLPSEPPRHVAALYAVASDLVMVKKPTRDRASSAFLTRKLNEPTSSSYVTGFL